MRNAILVTLVSLVVVSVLSYAQTPVPFVSLPLMPDAMAPGGGDFTLTINGTGFVSNSVVLWNGTALTTQFISASQLTAIVPAARIANKGTGWVTVANPAPGGGRSNTAFFTVTPSIGKDVPFTLASTFSLVDGLGYGFGNPWSAAVGDFNGDGKLDLAVVASDSEPLFILLGDGMGNFNLAAYPFVGNSPSAVAVGDFNGDGKVDVAVASTFFEGGRNNGVISIFQGDGKGNFTLTWTSPKLGSCLSSIAAGDFNGDGKLDLAIADQCDTGEVYILLGLGNGAFIPASAQVVGNEAMSVAVGDFNRDGNLDLAVAAGGGGATPAGTVSILLWDGRGNFTLSSSPVVAYGLSSVAVGDVNGDGKLDLAVVSSESDTVSILLGDGTGKFTLASSATVGQTPNSVAVGDFNGDGNLDLAVANQNSETVSILMGDGAGNFTLAWSPAVGFQPTTVLVGDFSGDGRLDLAVTNFCGADPKCTNREGSISTLLGSPPAPGLFPTALDFGPQVVGTSSKPQSLTLYNAGPASLNITKLASTCAGFFQTNNCGSSVAAGASCTINVSFIPSSIGNHRAFIRIMDDAINSPQSIPLTGIGTWVTLSPLAIYFGGVPMGTTGPSQKVTVTNHSKVALSISSVGLTGVVDGDFAQTNTCGTGVTAGGNCTVTVTFTPKVKGATVAILEITDNGGASPQTVTLHGTGK